MMWVTGQHKEWKIATRAPLTRREGPSLVKDTHLHPSSSSAHLPTPSLLSSLLTVPSPEQRCRETTQSLRRTTGHLEPWPAMLAGVTCPWVPLWPGHPSLLSEGHRLLPQQPEHTKALASCFTKTLPRWFTELVSMALPGIIIRLGQRVATRTWPQQSPTPGVVQLLTQLCSALQNPCSICVW